VPNGPSQVRLISVPTYWFERREYWVAEIAESEQQHRGGKRAAGERFLNVETRSEWRIRWT
jgi:hypothetical protein